MKKLFSIALLMTVTLAVQAGPYRYHHHSHHNRWHGRSSVSFHFGAYPYSAPFYSPSYAYYPSYAYAPAYGYGYGYSRPNRAVTGTLFGALTGGLIGNSINRQGWEGAGIGAAAGLVLGSLAERNARAQERAYYAAPSANSTAQAVTQVAPAPIAAAPTVNDAPVAPAAPQVRTTSTYRPAGSMAGANALFGR